MPKKYNAPIPLRLNRQRAQRLKFLCALYQCEVQVAIGLMIDGTYEGLVEKGLHAAQREAIRDQNESRRQDPANATPDGEAVAIQAEG